jgi:2-dehydro-3-deoxygluconokinase
MNYGPTIRQEGALICCPLGPSFTGWIQGLSIRKAIECQIHVSGGEFNVAANPADCFRLNTGNATAMVDYPV